MAKIKFWKVLLVVILAAVLLAGLLFSFGFFNVPEKEKFSADSVLIKVAIKTSGVYGGKLRVSANENSVFHAGIEGIGDLLSIIPETFELLKGETKELDLSFSNKNNLSEGIYTGSINLESGEKKKIPVIIEIESGNVVFDSNTAVFPATSISPGDKISGQIKIFDLGGIGTASVELIYFVKDFSGNVIISEKENIVVKDNLLITKSISLPENIKNGDYVFGVVVKYKNSVGTSSSSFKIGEESPVINKDYTIFILPALFFALVIVVLLFYFVYSRDKVLKELTCQYKSEIKRQDRMLELREKANEKQLKTKQEKKLNKEIFEKLKETNKLKIEKIHKERVRKLHALKKGKTTKNKMAEQIKKWKKQGYNTNILERKAPKPNDIRKQIAAWKKKGYNTKVIEEDLK